MSSLIIQSETLTSIADAIRAKTGNSGTLTPSQMATAISNISSGNTLTANITGDASFSGSLGTWLIQQYKYNNIAFSLSDVKSLSNMFQNNLYNGDLSDFVINCKANCNTNSSAIKLLNAFSGSSMTNIPTINMPETSCFGEMENMFGNNYMIEHIDDFTTYEANWNIVHSSSSVSYADFSSMFYSCYRLKSIDKNLLKQLYNSVSGNYCWGSTFYRCYCLEKIEDLGLFHPTATITSMDLSNRSTFKELMSLSSLTFSANGAPRNYSNVKIDLSNEVGYKVGSTVSSIITNYGATGGTSVATSVYNHDSAVETINSLPDCSAVSSPSNPTNIIYFRAGAGSATAGGSISDLTPAEIAVATNKGWSIQFNS